MYCLLETIATETSPQVISTLVVFKTILYDILISTANYFITYWNGVIFTTRISLQLQRPGVFGCELHRYVYIVILFYSSGALFSM